MKKLPAVFLDRDGTLIHDRDGHYLSSPAKLKLYRDTLPALRLLRALGLPLFIVTNQSGIGRGYFTEATARRINGRLALLLKKGGAPVRATEYCPHAPQDDCACRKPKPLMGRRLIKKHNVDASRSFMVGDKVSDMLFGRALGMRTILLRTGHGNAQARKPQAKQAADRVASGILQAARFIKNEIQDKNNPAHNRSASAGR